jgi:hypothetical protein
MLHQIDQNLKRLWTQYHFFAVAPQTAAVQVQREFGKAVLTWGPFSSESWRAASQANILTQSRTLCASGISLNNNEFVITS